MATLVLVHGSWLAAWCWDDVAARLRAAGHRVITPDLPGHGADTTPAGSITLAAYVDAVTRVVDAEREPVVLVGHSMAGVVIGSVAEQRPERIARLVYVAAYLPRDGESVYQLASTDAGSALGPHLRPDPDRGVIAVADEGYAVLLSGNPDSVIASGRGRSAPDPIAPLGTPLHLSAARYGRVPRTYVTTRADRAVSPALQDRMLTATPCERVVALETGHAPFLEAPERLATILAEAARP